MSKDSDDDDGAMGLNDLLNKQDGSDDDDDKDSGKSEDEDGSEYSGKSEDESDESDVDESDAEAKNGKLLAKQFLEGLPYYQAPGDVKDNIRTEPRMKEPTDTFTPFNAKEEGHVHAWKKHLRNTDGLAKAIVRRGKKNGQNDEKRELVQHPNYSAPQTNNRVRSKTPEDGDFDLNNKDDLKKIVLAFMQVTPHHLRAIIRKTFPTSSRDNIVSA